jgi:nucleotide-binding universal stress UspA family protein
MTVLREDDSVEAARNRLERAQEMLELPAARAEMRTGDPAEEILKEADEGDYDLVVVGRRAAANILTSLLRPVARKVADQAPTCVLVVNEDREALRRILICTAGLKVDEQVIQAGARLARAANAQTTILHVTHPVPSMYTGLEAMEETLPELLQTDTPLAEHLREGARLLADEGVSAEVKLRHGMAHDEIVREAEQGDYDLIVMGPNPSSGLRRLLTEDVTAQVIEIAPCPVLVVRESCEQV